MSSEIIEVLRRRGVIIHAPAACHIYDINPANFEAGVELFPGCTITGQETLIGSGTKLGQAGGGYFENLRAGRGCNLYGGYYKDCVLLDGVKVRGHAEFRHGTLLEEACSAAHHVGYKMTIQMPWTTAGSMVNFADTLIAGGRSQRDFTEIGSVIALYNYTPWGDKFASRFGDVPSGVFLDQERVFIGGQAQIVSPVRVGYGSVIAAGSSLRRDLDGDLLYARGTPRLKIPFDAKRYGKLMPKISRSFEYIGQLWALWAWYERVRLPAARLLDAALETSTATIEIDRSPVQKLGLNSNFYQTLYSAAQDQILAGIKERLHRLEKLAAKLPASLECWQALEAARDDPNTELAPSMIAEHRIVAELLDRKLSQLVLEPASHAENLAALDEVRDQLCRNLENRAELNSCTEPAGLSYPLAIQSNMGPEAKALGRQSLQTIVDAYARLN